MRVFLDTNIIFHEQFFRSVRAQTLLKAARFLGIEVSIPEIVLDEVVGNFPTQLAEQHHKYEIAARNLARLIDLDRPAISLEDRAAEYEAWLDALVDEYEVVVAPYPEVAAKELVTESYKGTKPFKASGDGYKDYLVWKTIVAQISQQSGDHESYFLTNNIADFCEENSGQFTLHPDLAKQIATEACRPIVYRSLEKFLTDKIAPRLEGINIANVPNLSTDGIHDRVQEVLENELEWYGAFGFEGLHFNNDVTVGMVGEAAIEEISLKELDEKDLIITVTGIVPIECYGYLDKSDYYSMNDDDSEEVHISEPDWNDHVMQVSQSITTPFEILFSYSKSDNAITGHSIEFPAEIENDWDK